MSFRGTVKRLVYATWPKGNLSFTYFGTRVFFPDGSLIFAMACDQGIYEADVVRVVNYLLVPGSYYFDIGANIGLMAVAGLASRPDCKVVSVEASPSTLKYLRRTHAESSFKDRWTIVGSAVGPAKGEVTFYEGPAAVGALDGLKDTGRSGDKQAITLPMTTIDQIWQDQGRPPVSVIKMDIEGGEHGAFKGAGELIAAHKPALVVEWSRLNLPAYGIPEDALLGIADKLGYEILSLPGYVAVRSSVELRLRMLETETFVLVPKSAGLI